MALVSRHTTRVRKKKKPRVSRRAQITADKKVLGDEPEFDEKITDENQKRLNHAIALNWYSRFTRHDDYLDEMKKYAAHLGYNDEQIEIFSKANWAYFSWNVKSHCRMYERGWHLPEESKNFAKDIFDKVLLSASKPQNAHKFVSNVSLENSEEENSEEKNVEEKGVKKESRLIEELDTLEDSWINGTAIDFNLYEKQQIYRESQGLLKSKVLAWVQSRISDLESWLKGDSQMREGLKVARKEIKSRLEVLNSIQNDIINSIASKKTERKPRKKKPIDPKKLISKLKFQKESLEYKIKSVDPINILDSSTVILFNTKYRSAIIITAEENKKLTVRGSNIEGGVCKAIRLRKPEQIIPILLEKNLNKITNTLNELSTKMVSGKPRSSKETIILRIFK